MICSMFDGHDDDDCSSHLISSQLNSTCIHPCVSCFVFLLHDWMCASFSSWFLDDRAILMSWIVIVTTAVPVALAHSVRIYQYRGHHYTACVFSSDNEKWSLLWFQVSVRERERQGEWIENVVILPSILPVFQLNVVQSNVSLYIWKGDMLALISNKQQQQQAKII